MSFLFSFFLFVSAQAQKGLESEAIRKSIRPHMDQTVKCYETSGMKEQGKLVLHWTINPKGLAEKVSIVETKSTLKDPKVRECMIKEIGTWKFPPPVGDAAVEVTYPFVFQKAN